MPFFCPFLLCLEICSSVYLVSMLGNSEIRQLYPSVSFLFARLRVSLGSFCTRCPSIKGFAVRGHVLSLVLIDLFPLLRQSVDWFEELMGSRGIMSEVRSSELETRLSSSDDPVEVEVDTAASSRREVRAFHALGEACALDSDTLSKFRDRFQFPERVRIRLPHKEERACHFSPREVCFYEVAFQCGLRFPIHPFIMELLNHFNIASRTLMPSSWRILISCMEIWMVITEGDMIRVDDFIHLYRLKESREYGYYDLMPWVRKARIITDLPSLFRY